MLNINELVLNNFAQCLERTDFFWTYKSLCEPNKNGIISLKKDEMITLLKNTKYKFKYDSTQREFVYKLKLNTFDVKFILKSRTGWIIPYIIVDLIDQDNLYLISDSFDTLGEKFKTGYRETIIINPWPQCVSIEEGKVIIDKILIIFMDIEKALIDEFGMSSP
jgi:hypothetical protein